MPDPLLLRLPRTGQQHATWLALGSGAELSPESGPLSLAAPRAAGRRVIVLVPGAEVLLMQPQLPAARSGMKPQQLVPYALEEQLADDIDELHFAIGRRTGTRTAVAVVARSRMDQWLAALRSSGIEPAAVYADSELLPANPTQTVALLEDDAVTLRSPSGRVLMLPVENLGEALEAPEEGALNAGGLILYAREADWARHSAKIEALRERLQGIHVQLLATDPLVLFAQQLSSASAIDLLQGPYAPASAMASSWRTWRVAALLLAALVVLHLAGQGTELIVLSHRNSQLEASIGQVFRSAMPGAGDTEEARRRMEQRLKQVRAGEAAGGFLKALGVLAQARTRAPGTHLEAVSFRSGVLDLKLSAPTVEVLDELTRSLKQQGWRAQLVSGNPHGARFEGDIRMSQGS